MAESEYGGVDSPPATVQPKGQDALTADDQMRLIRLTGTTDPLAPRDNQRAWQGLAPNSQYARVEDVVR